MNDQRLAEIFAEAGTVVSAKVIVDKFSGRSRGFAFVEMASQEEGKKAIELLHQKDIDGRPLVVNEARPREDKPRN